MTKGRGRIESFPALICPQGQSADHHGQLDTRAKPAAGRSLGLLGLGRLLDGGLLDGCLGRFLDRSLFNLLRRRHSRQPRSSNES